MNYRVLRSAACDRDLSLIFDRLFETYQELGDPPEVALEHAASRVRSIQDDMEGIGQEPFQGKLCSGLLPNLRWCTKNQVTFYFQIDESETALCTLAVLSTNQDFCKKMLLRLSRPE